MSIHRFRNRVHAGQLLASALAGYANRADVIVLGMPRGGVPVAFEVARKLRAPLDVIIVRKLGVPGCEELAMGAIASGGIRYINEMVVWRSGVSSETIDKVATKELKELRRREIAYRGHEGTPEIGGKVVILVDDGIATGSTLQAAIRTLREQGPARIIVAVPTAPPEVCAGLESIVDEVICLITPEEFQSVGKWYDEFTQTSDEEVTRLLEASSARAAPQTPQKRPAAAAQSRAQPFTEPY